MEKPLYFGILAGISLLSSFPATAQSEIQTERTVRIDFNAEVGQLCRYTGDGEGISVDLPEIDPDGGTIEIDADIGSQLSFVCNSPQGFTQRIESANGGVLMRTAGSSVFADSIAYLLRTRIGDGPLSAPVSLSQPLEQSIDGNGSLLSGIETQVLIIIPDAQGGEAFAGDYTDTLSFTITSN